MVLKIGDLYRSSQYSRKGFLNRRGPKISTLVNFRQSARRQYMPKAIIWLRAARSGFVDVRKGPVSGDQVSVRGELKPGDTVVKQATDEIREGALLP